jgi:hypothetical protein
VMSYYLWTGWFIWAILLQISSLRHPHVADWPTISGKRVLLAALAVIMLALTLMPAPFLHSSLPEVIRDFRGQ